MTRNITPVPIRLEYDGTAQSLARRRLGWPLASLAAMGLRASRLLD